jgi:hypothetical protein
VRLRTLVLFLIVSGLLQLGCASRVTPVTARVTGASNKPIQSRLTPSRDPFKKLKDALDSATRRSTRAGGSPADSAREAGLIGRDEPAAVGTSGHETAGPAAPADADPSVREREADVTQGGDTPSAQHAASSTDRSVLRMAGIALVIVGLALGLFAYSRRGTRT